MKSVVIDQAEIITPFGYLHETVSNLSEGAFAIVSGPCFETPVAYAPFRNLQFRDLTFSFTKLLQRIKIDKIDLSSTLLLFCAAKGDIQSLEQYVFSKAYTSAISPLLDIQAKKICNIFGLDPFKINVLSNACASGSIGIETAIDLLRMERFSHIIVCGFDCLSRFTTKGFYSLGALSKHRARPFDKSRDGLTMGEGAGIAILSYKEVCEGDIVIMGAGSTNDANHRTGPSYSGDGLYKAGKMALNNALLNRESVGVIKCHGTATQYNDSMEAKALHSLFGDNCPPAVSYKGALGHMSGAGSLIEIIIMGENLKKRILPPTKGFNELGVDEKISISSKIQEINKPIALCLAAGFGGLNSAVIIKEQN